MSIFQQASRLKLRFASTIGLLTVEHLWDLPLVSKTGSTKPDLDTIGREIKRELRTMEEDTLVETKRDPQRDILTLRLAIIVAIIETKQAEIKKAEEAAVKREKRRKLQEALARHDDKALESASRDEILKQLAEIDAD